MRKESRFKAFATQNLTRWLAAGAIAAALSLGGCAWHDHDHDHDHDHVVVDHDHDQDHDHDHVDHDHPDVGQDRTVP